MVRTRLLRRRVTPVLQTADTDCGPACLTMILASFGMNVSMSRTRDLIDPGRDGATAGALRDAAGVHGIRARAVRLPPRSITETGTPLPAPFIAHWDNNHFVVVANRRGRTIGLIDPAIGRRRLTKAEFVEHATGVVLLFERDNELAPAAATPIPAQPSPVKLILLPLIHRHRGRLALTILMSLVLTVLGLTVPAAIALITNTLAAGSSPSPAWVLVVPILAGAMGLLALIRGLGAATLQRGLAQDLTFGVAQRMFESTYRYFERRSTGDLFMRIASADMVRELLGVAMVGSLLDTILAAGYLTVIFWLDPLLAAVTAATLSTQLILVLLLTAKARTRHREELLAAADADSRIVDAIMGIASIRSCAAEATVLKRWSVFVERRLSAATRRSRTNAVTEAVSTTGQFGAPVLFLLVAATGATSPGAALGLAALAGAVLAPLAGLTASLVGLAELNPLLERILDTVNAPPEGGSTDRQPTPRLVGSIELINAGFRYDTRSPFVFRGLDVNITPGMKVAVIGSSGCGKSTLISALTGLHELAEGRLLFDGRDISTLELPSLRRQFGVVLQDPYLGIGTIREAITLGRADVTEEEMVRVARMAAIHDEITAMPLGYDTRVNVGGRGVSAGQRQRIGFARALIGSPSVLILDEATSALDVATESRIEEGLRTLNMTRIVIAHRLSTIADADLVLVMHQGRFVEAGSPATLLNRNGRYAAMVALQNGASVEPNSSRTETVTPEPGSRTGRHRAPETAHPAEIDTPPRCTGAHRQTTDFNGDHRSMKELDAAPVRSKADSLAA